MQYVGIHLYAVSTCQTYLRRTLKTLAYLFNRVIISAEVGVEKPSEAIFEAMSHTCASETSVAMMCGAAFQQLLCVVVGTDLVPVDENVHRLACGNIAFDGRNIIYRMYLRLGVIAESEHMLYTLLHATAV